DLETALAELGFSSVRLRKNLSNEYELKATMNGTKEMDVLINFQFTQSLFNTEVLDRIGMPYQETGQEFNMNGDEDDMYSVKVDSLSIGGASVGAQEIMSINFSEFDILEDYRVGGIIGRDFLLSNKVLIDFGDQKLFVRSTK